MHDRLPSVCLFYCSQVLPCVCVLDSPGRNNPNNEMLFHNPFSEQMHETVNPLLDYESVRPLRVNISRTIQILHYHNCPCLGVLWPFGSHPE